MNNYILGIETSSDICGISLFNNKTNIDIIEKKNSRKHAEVLPNYVISILKNNQLKVNDISAVAVSIGPGSFTGLRVGLSFAKGLVYAIKCPIIPVPTILSLAYGLKDKEPNSGIIKSHGDKIFFQEFNWDSKIPSIKSKPVLGNIYDYLNKFKNGFHYNCDEFLKNTKTIYRGKPSANNVGALANIYYEDWSITKPYDLISDYIYPYNVKSNG